MRRSERRRDETEAEHAREEGPREQTNLRLFEAIEVQISLEGDVMPSRSGAPNPVHRERDDHATGRHTESMT